ncbi:nuclear protein localization protein 4, partial [Pancytospora epiphaga]
VCDDHPKNVKCMKCTEKVITLAPQIYRRIDYVEFDNKACLESFIGKWRSSGRQRLGLLIGRYADHKQTPGGRRVVISGIWETEQENYPDGAVLQCIPRTFIYKGLEIVGSIYTDLWLRDGAQFSYKQKLGHVVSAMELNYFYEVQSAIHNPDFVHICVCSDDSGNILPEVFMITSQFIGLMNARLLRLTTDPASFETERDMSYLIKNEYNRNVPIQAKPFVPVDYFVVNCGLGYKDSPLFSNQTMLGKTSLKELSRHFTGEYSFERFSSFSVLVALHKHTPCAAEIFKAVLKNDRDAFEKLKNTDNFEELCSKLEEYNITEWNCRACTYLNNAQANQCEVCQEPR